MTNKSTLEEVKNIIKGYGEETGLPQKTVEKLIAGIREDKNGNANFIDVIEVMSKIAHKSRRKSLKN